MKDNDTQLIAEAYFRMDEGALGSAGKVVGKAAGKVGLAGAGLTAKGAGISLDFMLKALNFLTAEQLKKLGDVALEKALGKEEEPEQDDNDQFAPEEAAADDQLGEMEPLDGENEENNLSKIEASLEKIADELKTLNQYADFMTTGTRAQGFTGGTKQQ
jgi:hypothetical protein